MYFIGYDIGSSSVKACLLDGQTGKTVASATSPDTELPILALQAGWAEQDPHTWWEHLVKATAIILKDFKHKEQISAIGISYQMHGLVAVNKEGKPLRNSIIWCDSRAVSIGNHALEEMGKNFCLHHYLNSPGNFTASKLKWVKENEPKIYEQIHKIMLPGDYIAYLLSGKIQTTITGLSEGILWDFAQETIATDLLKHYGIDSSLIPEITDNFKVQATLQESVAHLLGLPLGIPITYRAGDQPNNAFSLQVLHPGEIAATAGTSGVVYGVNKQTNYDPQSRVNNFAHVNHKANDKRIGILLCVNGTGIANSWMRRLASRKELLSYPELNEMASQSEIGAKGIRIYPFGNGAERMLSNQDSGARMEGLQFNIHTINDLLRATQEGIVYSLNYGIEIMKAMGMNVNVVRAGNANMFLSPIFSEAFVNTTGASVELYDTDGAQGAARAAGLGLGHFKSEKEAFVGLSLKYALEPNKEKEKLYAECYSNWKMNL